MYVHIVTVKEFCNYYESQKYIKTLICSISVSDAFKDYSSGTIFLRKENQFY